MKLVFLAPIVLFLIYSCDKGETVVKSHTVKMSIQVEDRPYEVDENFSGNIIIENTGNENFSGSIAILYHKEGFSTWETSQDIENVTIDSQSSVNITFSAKIEPIDKSVVSQYEVTAKLSSKGNNQFDAESVTEYSVNIEVRKTAPNGDIFLKTQAELEEFAKQNYTHAENLIIGTSTYGSNNAVNDINPLEGLVELDELVIWSTNLISVSGFTCLKTINYGMAIIYNPKLKSIYFPELKSVAGKEVTKEGINKSISIRENKYLETIIFPKLEELLYEENTENHLVIEHNGRTTLDRIEFPELKKVYGHFGINVFWPNQLDNSLVLPKLELVNGNFLLWDFHANLNFPELHTIRGNLDFSGDGYFDEVYLPKLTKLGEDLILSKPFLKENGEYHSPSLCGFVPLINSGGLQGEIKNIEDYSYTNATEIVADCDL